MQNAVAAAVPDRPVEDWMKETAATAAECASSTETFYKPPSPLGTNFHFISYSTAAAAIG